MTLQLEYSCTQAEMKEAQSLHLRQHYGGGSKWKMRLKLFGFLAFLLVLLGFYIKNQKDSGEPVWIFALAVVIYVGLLVFRRLTRNKSDKPVRVEISERDLVIDGGNGRVSLLWSGFSQCLESTNVFALMDRSRLILYVLPKRAFPNSEAQDWFRDQAKQISGETPAVMTGETFGPGRIAPGNGIALSVQLGYRDYLSRNVTSWRMKGIALGIFLFIICLMLFMPMPPDAVNSRTKTFLIMTATLVPMFAIVFFVASYISWRSEKKYLKREHYVLTDEGIEFATDNSSGRLAWNTYKYYLENRWTFFVWNTRGSIWLMLPKRLFASASDLEQCHGLLRKNLKWSRWFYL